MEEAFLQEGLQQGAISEIVRSSWSATWRRLLQALALEGGAELLLRAGGRAHAR